MSVITASPSAALVGGHYEYNDATPNNQSDFISPDDAATVSQALDAASRLVSAGGSQYNPIKADVAKHLHSEIFQGDGTGAGFDQAGLEAISREDRGTFQQASDAYNELAGLKSQLRDIDQRTGGAVSDGLTELFGNLDHTEQEAPKLVKGNAAQTEGRELAGRDVIGDGYDMSSLDDIVLSSLSHSFGEASYLSTGWDRSTTGPEYKQIEGPPALSLPEPREVMTLPEHSQQHIESAPSYHMDEDEPTAGPPSRYQRGITSPPIRSKMDFNALKDWYLTRVSRRTEEPKTMFDFNQTAATAPQTRLGLASHAPRTQPRTGRGYTPSAAPSQQPSIISGAASSALDGFFSFGGDAAQTIRSALQSGADGEFVERETEDGGMITRGQASGVTADGRRFSMMVSKSVSGSIAGSRTTSIFGGPLTAR
ncbi:hypothetical protein IAR50_002725 [Cryptococcus sp. DSM 104548]